MMERVGTMDSPHICVLFICLCGMLGEYLHWYLPGLKLDVVLDLDLDLIELCYWRRGCIAALTMPTTSAAPVDLMVIMEMAHQRSVFFPATYILFPLVCQWLSEGLC